MPQLIDLGLLSQGSQSDSTGLYRLEARPLAHLQRCEQGAQLAGKTVALCRHVDDPLVVLGDLARAGFPGGNEELGAEGVDVFDDEVELAELGHGSRAMMHRFRQGHGFACKSDKGYDARRQAYDGGGIHLRRVSPANSATAD